MRNNYILGNEKLTEKEFSDKYWMGGQEEYIYQFHTMDIEDGKDERQQLLINNDRALFNLTDFIYKQVRKSLYVEVEKMDKKISKLKKAIRYLAILGLLEAGIIILQFLLSLLR